MAASSKHLKAIFQSKFESRNENEFIFENINGSTLQMIINYCYSGNIAITESNVNAIMTAASNLKIASLQKKCGNFWQANLTTGNCIQLMLEANNYNLTELRKKSFDFMSEHFGSISIAEIVQMHALHLCTLLSQDQITTSEAYIFDVMVKWVEHNEADWVKFVPYLLDRIRFRHLPAKVIHFPKHASPTNYYHSYIFQTNSSFSKKKSNHSARNTIASTIF